MHDLEPRRDRPFEGTLPLVGGPFHKCRVVDLQVSEVRGAVSRAVPTSFSADDPIPPPNHPDPYGGRGVALYRAGYVDGEVGFYWFLRIDWATPLEGFEGAERGW